MWASRLCCLSLEVIVLIKQNNLTWTSGRCECMSIKQDILILEEFICTIGELNIAPCASVISFPVHLTLFRAYRCDLEELKWGWHLFLSNLISQNRTLECFWAPCVYFIFYFSLDLLPSWLLYRWMMTAGWERASICPQALVYKMGKRMSFPSRALKINWINKSKTLNRYIV